MQHFMNNMLQDQASGERFQDQWSSGLYTCRLPSHIKSLKELKTLHYPAEHLGSYVIEHFDRLI